MCVFTFCGLRFGWRLYMLGLKERCAPARQRSTDITELRSSLPKKLFLGALALSTLCILARCAYRVAELSEGWMGDLAHDKLLFIVFEGVMVLVASTAMLVFHPVWIYPRPDILGRRVLGTPLERPWIPSRLGAWVRSRAMPAWEGDAPTGGVWRLSEDVAPNEGATQGATQGATELKMMGTIPAGEQPPKDAKQPSANVKQSMDGAQDDSEAAGSSRLPESNIV